MHHLGRDRGVAAALAATIGVSPAVNRSESTMNDATPTIALGRANNNFIVYSPISNRGQHGDTTHWRDDTTLGKWSPLTGTEL